MAADIKKINGNIVAECPYCDWSKGSDGEFTTVQDAASSLRAHIRFRCDEGSEEKFTVSSELKDDSEEEEKESEDSSQQKSDGSSSTSSSGKGFNWKKVGAYAAVGAGVLYAVKSYFDDDNSNSDEGASSDMKEAGEEGEGVESDEQTSSSENNDDVSSSKSGEEDDHKLVQ